MKRQAQLESTRAEIHTGAHAFDPLLAERDISATAGGTIAPVCEFSGPPSSPLLLAEAVERTLCGNPKTRAAWAAVKAQAAGVGAARAAYLPQISANWQGVRESSVVDIENHPALSENINAFTRTAGVSLNWLLYDFGGREAALRNANALLDAVRPTDLERSALTVYRPSPYGAFLMQDNIAQHGTYFFGCSRSSSCRIG